MGELARWFCHWNRGARDLRRSCGDLRPDQRCGTLPRIAPWRAGDRWFDRDADHTIRPRNLEPGTPRTAQSDDANRSHRLAAAGVRDYPAMAGESCRSYLPAVRRRDAVG